MKRPLAFLAPALLLAASSAFAGTTLYWDPNGATANSGTGAGTWDATTNAFWNTALDSSGSASIWNNANGDTAVFAATGFTGAAASITLSGAITAAGIQSNIGSFVLDTTTAGNSLTIGSGGITLSLPTTNVNTSLQLGKSSSAGAYTFGGTTQTWDLTSASLSATRTILLSAANYTDGGNDVTITVNGFAGGNQRATVQVGSANTGTWNTTSSVTFNNSTLQLNGTTSSGIFGGTTAGTGALLVFSNGRLAQATSSAANSIYNNTKLTGNLTFQAASGTTAGTVGYTLKGAMDLNGVTRTITAGGDGTGMKNVEISGIIGNGGLTKAGTGTLILSGNNTYTGGTTVSAGTLTIASTGSVNVTDATAGVSIGSGATLTVNGTLKLLGNTTTGVIANSGTFDLSGGTGILDLNNLFTGVTDGQQYKLFGSIGTISGNFSGINNIGAAGFSAALNTGTGIITFTAVPEPATYGLLGAGALAGMAFVRRRRKVA